MHYRTGIIIIIIIMIMTKLAQKRLSKQLRKTTEHIIPLWLSWGQTTSLRKNNAKASKHTTTHSES
jgi:hypothetical protein